ncbi:MAG: IreB family regulatory phosphoprotein [Peptococcaceae bacterium]|nr:IreB family regulatory phosphoprotein [Peptococcaceae bacterium]
MNERMDDTKLIQKVELDRRQLVRDVLEQVCEALREKGYNPSFHIAGYLLSGDPAYITYHKQARNTIRRVERDEILEELLDSYLNRG